MPLGQPSNWSHCVPGAISNGPCSIRVSTPVRLKASEFSRRPLLVASGTKKSRCQGWSSAPGKGMSKPISTIRYSGPSTASHTATNQGWVAMSTKPETRSGCTSTYQRCGPRGSAPPSTFLASSNSANMSSRIRSAQAREKAPLRAMMPSP
jgi:hypothetical protein